MGRIIVSNNKEWLDTLEESQCIAGMRLNKKIETPVSLLCYYKYRVDNDNFYKADESTDFVATSGSLIYKEKFGIPALRELLADYKRYGIKYVRENLMGNFFAVLSVDGNISAFVDETGTYSVYYFVDESTGDYLLTNTFYHVQKCVGQPLKGREFLEYVTIPSIFDNQSPFEGVMRLAGDEVIMIADEKLTIAKTQRNEFELLADNFEQASEKIADAVLRYTKKAAAIPYERILFLTGGVDSRLLLSAHLAANTDISIGNWQGSPVDMNTKSEDGLISKELADKCSLRFSSFDVDHDISNDLENVSIERYERYGEYASIYGGNKKWFEVFEKGPYVYWDFGHIGEVLRDVEELETAYYEGISLKDYYRAHLRQQCADFSFTGTGSITPENLDENIYEKFLDYCNSVGINVESLKKRDCYELHNVGLLHSDMIKANLYNMIGYYTNVYSQKEVFDYSLALDASYRKNKKLIISMIDKLCPSLNEVQYFTRCRFMDYNSESNSLSEVSAKKTKDSMKRLLKKTSLGTALLKSRRDRIDKAHVDEFASLVSKYLESINGSSVMKSIGAVLDDKTFTYLPNYGIFCASCNYVDRVLSQEQVATGQSDSHISATVDSSSLRGSL